MKFRIAFLNCKDLYPVGGHATRSLSSQDALETRIEKLALTLRNLFEDPPAEIIGLCEVGTEAIGKQLANALKSNFYETVWSGVPPHEGDKPETGLMLLYDPVRVRVNPTAKRYNSVPEMPGDRIKWIAVNLSIQQFGNAPPFWLVLNHWTSAVRHGFNASEPERMKSAKQIGDMRLELNQEREYRDQAMILIGDFNCEPFDRPFKDISGHSLRSVREKRLVLRRGNQKAYFYNPTWRWLSNLSENVPADSKASLPPGTILFGDEWHIYDQLMVSKEALEEEGSFLRFIESTLTMNIPEANCSDHCAIGAVFEAVLNPMEQAENWHEQ